MRRFSLLFVVLGCVVIAAVLTWWWMSSAGVRYAPRAGSASESRPAMQTRPVPPFTRLEVSGTADVTLVQGTAETLAHVPVPDRQGRIDAEVRDGTLYVDVTDNTRWWDGFFGGKRARRPQLVVTFRELDSIAAAGRIRLNAAGIRTRELRIAAAGGTFVRIDELQTQRLVLAGSGALEAELAGRADHQEVTISGAGDYRGERLLSQTASVRVNGAAQVVVSASKTLHATISGAGSVEYLGNPEVTRRVSGVGSVRRRGAEIPAPAAIAFLR